jgi:hypothetical protein
MTSLFEPSTVERHLAGLLKEKAVSEIERRNDVAGVAQDLGIAPSGVQALLIKSEWTLEQAIRVAEGLKIIDDRMAERLAG